MMSENAAAGQIAIIGMAARFPGARNVHEYWQNLQDGIESICFFSDDELKLAGLSPELLADPRYVKARGMLEDADLFDAPFFSFTARDAAVMDPQYRVFLECAWHSLEDAGYDPARSKERIGIFAGAFTNYYAQNVEADPQISSSIDPFQLRISTDKDFLPTWVSYKLNLGGPSIAVQTACSTSLVSVHLACQSLLGGECDIALAGGVTVHNPEKQGYLSREGGIEAPDGHCRVFDAKARGTVNGSGVGIVVLKRLEEALEDRDNIRAVIKGSAVNNDGAMKVGYAAPSVRAQAEVIAEALSVAGVEPETIGFVEAHGTGTPLGDPIEVAALTEAYRTKTQKEAFCAIGSVKANIGHLDAAAGIASLIKATLVLKHKRIPPNINFDEPNPEINFVNSPFYVNSDLREWNTGPVPHRVGVSSFGIGGTNAHVILEEAPPSSFNEPSTPWHLLSISARTSSALEKVTTNLAEHLESNLDLHLADVAYTLNVGRKAFPHRRVALCQDMHEGVAMLKGLSPKQMPSAIAPDHASVTFMFPGQGAQHSNMGLDLYQHEEVFRTEVDHCAKLLQPHLNLDLRRVLYSQGHHVNDELNQTQLVQPALFTVEYALARQLMSWGIKPEAMIGHSLGEYVAACIAGVLSVENALRIVAVRGKLMQRIDPGAMLTVLLPEDEMQPFLNHNLSLAAVNSPSVCVVSGPLPGIDALQDQLKRQRVVYSRLNTSHAFHSSMVEPVIEEFDREMQKIHLQPPQIPYISNLTGTWITEAEATDPSYWTTHMRQTVLFAQGLNRLLSQSDGVLLEVGPGHTLGTFAKKQAAQEQAQAVLFSMRRESNLSSDHMFLLSTVGKLWLAGVNVDWPKFYNSQRRRRVPLPLYPFERARYWIGHHTVAGGQAKLNLREGEVESVAGFEGVESPSRVEKLISGIWQTLFGLDYISVHDDFFDLGGNSLHAIQLISRLREELGVELPLTSLYEASTVAQLAKIIKAQEPKTDDLQALDRLLSQVESLNQ